METFFLILLLAAMVGGAGYYLYRAKKRGQTCVGCPYAKSCGSQCHCSNRE